MNTLTSLDWHILLFCFIWIIRKKKKNKKIKLDLNQYFIFLSLSLFNVNLQIPTYWTQDFNIQFKYSSCKRKTSSERPVGECGGEKDIHDCGYMEWQNHAKLSWGYCSSSRDQPKNRRTRPYFSAFDMSTVCRETYRRSHSPCIWSSHRRISCSRESKCLTALLYFLPFIRFSTCRCKKATIS